MSLAVRVTAAYLCIASAWVCGADWLFAGTLPDVGGIGSSWTGLVFLSASSVLLYSVLLREGARRDAVLQALRDDAIHDPLTGLLNRTCFVELFEKALAAASRDKGLVGVAFIDLDGFKDINDRFGHQVGDHLLGDVGKRILACVRTCDSAARLGGDEFVVLVRGDVKTGMPRLAERLAKSLKEPFLVAGARVSLTASVGLACYPEDGATVAELLREADLAMYRVKASGKDGILAAPCKGGLKPAVAA
jgi:diguanylate cyclase (GGDEF)-like protein